MVIKSKKTVVSGVLGALLLVVMIASVACGGSLKDLLGEKRTLLFKVDEEKFHQEMLLEGKTEEIRQERMGPLVEVLKKRVQELLPSHFVKPEVRVLSDGVIEVKVPASLDTKRIEKVLLTKGYLGFHRVRSNEELLSVIEKLDKKFGTDWSTQLAKWPENTEKFRDVRLYKKEGFEELKDFINNPKTIELLPLNTRIVQSLVSTDEKRGKFVSVFLIEEPPQIGGDVFSDVRRGAEQILKDNIIMFQFDSEGSKKFGDLTESCVGEKVGIVLDDVLLSAPVVQGKITRSGQISLPDFSEQETEDLAIILRSGPLPMPIVLQKDETVKVSNSK